MIILNSTLYIGEGNQRTVYNHPDDAKLCIKIIKPNSKTAVRRQLREIKYYKRLTRKRISFDNISAFLGEVETNKGTGYIYEKVLDHDGQTSEGLENTLNQLSSNSEETDKLIKKIKNLGLFLKKNRIIFHDYFIRDNKNILCKKDKDGSFTLIIVDALGDTTALPITHLSKRLSDKRITRKWNKFLVEPTVILIPWIEKQDLEIS